jgi:hypothetical protein
LRTGADLLAIPLNCIRRATGIILFPFYFGNKEIEAGERVLPAIRYQAGEVPSGR